MSISWSCSACTFVNAATTGYFSDDNYNDSSSNSNNNNPNKKKPTTTITCEMCGTVKKDGRTTTTITTTVMRKRSNVNYNNSNKNNDHKRSTTKQQTLFGRPVESTTTSTTATSNDKVNRKRKEPPSITTTAMSNAKSRATGTGTATASNKSHPFFAPSSSGSSSLLPSPSLLQPPVPPLYTVPSTKQFSKAEIQTALQCYFGLDTLRPNLQSDAISNALQQTSQLLVLATGGGKSLCFQLPACVLGGVTMVISPLLALMQDQVQALQHKGIPAALISSQQTSKQNDQILNRLLFLQQQQKQPQPQPQPQSTKNHNNSSTNKNSRSNGPITLLYITPESIQTEKMRQVLHQLHQQKRLTMFAVDEAHCLSSWGHDFRPAYRRLSYLRTTFPNVPCLACTATATPQVIQDIQTTLRLEKSPLLKGSFDRPNIFYKVKYKQTMTHANGPLDEMLSWIIKQHAKANDNQQHEQQQQQQAEKKCSGIVYVHKREDTVHIANTLQSKARQERITLRAEPYHAGLNKADRNRVLDEWSNDVIQVAVATVAFGMGIDLPHVRYVIHWSMAKTIEGFYQESGRAGRDGLPSHSILYYDPDDVSKFQFLIRKQAENSKSKQSKHSTNNDDQQCERKLQALEQMTNYCITPTCRRNALISHFGGDLVKCQKTCDYCQNPQKVERSIQSANIRIRETIFGKSSSSSSSHGRNWNRRNNNNNTNNDPLFVAYDNNHGLLSVDDEDEYDDDSMARRDWDDGMIGDLKVTDAGRNYVHKDYKTGYGFVKASSLKDRTAAGSGGFVKASDVLDKYAKMEQRNKYDDENDNDDQASSNKDFRPAPIPDHFRIPVSKKSIKTIATTAVALSSQDHHQKTNQLRQELATLQAEQERRMQALLAKQQQNKRQTQQKS